MRIVLGLGGICILAIVGVAIIALVITHIRR